LRVDPVMPRALDGLRVMTSLAGRPIELDYRVGEAGCGVNKIVLNGAQLSFNVGSNPHRRGAVLLDSKPLMERMTSVRNQLRIEIG